MTAPDVQTITGVIDTVKTEPVGSVLSADATAGDGLIFVDDTSEFDGVNGGTFGLNGNTYPYNAVDDDTGQITLDGVTLLANASDGDRVDVWDVANGEAATELRALVALPGQQASAEAIDAEVAQALAVQLDVGQRDPGAGESVEMTRRGLDWVVTDVRGKKPQITNNRNQYDRLTVTYTADAATWVSVNPPPAWDSIDDLHGSSIEIDGGSSGIRMKQPGVYAVNGSVFVSGIEAADPATSVRLELVAGTGSYPDVMWAGCGLRGGDASGLGTVASCGLTYWRSGNDAQSLIFAYINTANLDLVAISSILVTVAVQRII